MVCVLTSRGRAELDIQDLGPMPNCDIIMLIVTYE